jgi:hypothetical protein
MLQPPWQREPLVARIANMLLDRLERGPQERVRQPRLKLDSKSAPELFAASARESDYQWSLLQRMQEAGWIRLVVDHGASGESEYYRNPRVELADEQALRQLVQRPLRTEPDWHERFLDALATLLPPSHPALDEASRCSLPLQAYDPGLVATRLVSVRQLAEEPLLLREVSSRLFFAQSKALDGREALIAAMLEQPECPFPESPIQLSVHLPAQEFAGVLFVENLATFEGLARRRPPATDALAIVYASGYRCSAKRLRTTGGVSVYFSAAALPTAAHADRFVNWLARAGPEVPVSFFGDLDFAGLAILAKLRQTFADATAWRAGYEPLLARLEAGGGHAPAAARKEGQRDPGTTGSVYADEVLLPAIRMHDRFVDQELGA